MSIFTKFKVKRQIGKLRRPKWGRDINYNVRQQAIVNLVNSGSPAVEPLIQSLDNGYDTESVIEALGQLGHSRAVEPIFKELATACLTGDEEIRDAAIVALKRIGEPAQKYAAEMSERPSEKLSKNLGSESYIRQAANFILEGGEQDREDEQLANKLVTLISQAISVYSSDKKAYQKTSSEIKKIGEDICANGGSERMTKIAYQVQALGQGIRNLELHWQGICGWQF